MNNWKLTDEIRNKIKPIIEKYIEKISSIEYMDELEDEDKSIDLTFKGISPMQLRDLLGELGYEEISNDSNGWQHDFWYYFINRNKSGCAYKICMCGCGMTFELKLRPEEY